MNRTTIDQGIIDLDSNPFAIPSWVKQAFALTPGRQKQLAKLFGQYKEQIRTTHSENDGMYVAFIAIRWGFASMINEKLTPTEKWINRDIYDGLGRPLKKNDYV